MSKARDLANAGTALGAVTATELAYVDGVTSAIQTQIDSKIGSASAINPTIVDAKGDIIAASAADTPARLAVGTNDQILVADSSTATGLKWATPATGSTNITLKRARTTSTTTFLTIATDGSTKWVIAGSSGALHSSTDSGATWTSRTSGFSTSTIRKVTYGNGTFVAVGDAGLISSSTDAITWTARTSGFGSSNIFGIDYVNGYFIATGRDTPNTRAGVSTSTDGITWTFRTTPSGSTLPARCATYGNGYYFVGGDNNSYNAMYSTDLATWTNITTTAQDIVKAFYENNQFITFNPQTSGENYYTGSNPSTGWNYFYPSTSTGVVSNAMIDSYGGNIYAYSSAGPELSIIKAKLQVVGGTGLSLTEIYKPYTKELPMTLSAIVSKGDGTFGLLNTQGYVWFTS